MRKSIIFLAFAILFHSFTCKSQGCLSIRNVAGFGQFAALGYEDNDQKWMLDINNRYFHANQLYKGKENVTPPNPQNGLSIHEYTLNLELSRILNKGWLLAVDLPVSANTISDK